MRQAKIGLRKRSALCFAVLCAALGGCRTGPGAGGDPLPSWNEVGARSAIVAFVEGASDGPGAIAPAERIAVFDNDGTLWAEQPAYFQLLFAIDRVHALAPQRPEWRTTEPFKSLLAGDLHAALSSEAAVLDIINATHAGMTTDEFDATVRDWLATARHPTTGRPYTEMVYQPMLELLDYLRSRGFRTYIVSGGGVDFIRVFAHEVYGVPREQVVGSVGEVEYRVENGEPRLVRTPGVAFIDDKEGKPVGIHRRIGRRPVMAVGNSDGDFQMLEWTTAGDGPRLGVLVHHTDAQREWAYDRDSHIGSLKRGLDEAHARGWVVVDMRRDWRTIHPKP